MALAVAADPCIDAEVEHILDVGTSDATSASRMPGPHPSRGRPSRKAHEAAVKAHSNGNASKPILSFFQSSARASQSQGPQDTDARACVDIPDTPAGVGVGGAGNSHAAGSLSPLAVACPHCGSHEVVTRLAESLRLCTACDAVETIVVDNERPVKRDAPKDSASFTFKRLSHFNEWLAQIQGKDNPTIPEEVIGFVMAELRRHNIVNAAKVTATLVREILKKLKLSRYYEHVPYIISRILGVPSERMPPVLEEKLRHMFRKIQVPFVKHSPASRKNFLSYGYVLHKFVQLLGEDEYLAKFPLLKSREKLRMQDNIWRAICQDLDWEFIPSI